MHFLASLRAADVDPDAQKADTTDYTLRIAGRAIVFNGSRVALIKIGKHGYFMLPGGGVNDDSIDDGLKREIREELGCNIRIGRKVGVIETFIDRWHKRQIDHCFIAYTDHHDTDRRLTTFEQEEDHRVIWTKGLDEAINLVGATTPEVLDGKLIKARDLLFLQTARSVPV